MQQRVQFRLADQHRIQAKNAFDLFLEVVEGRGIDFADSEALIKVLQTAIEVADLSGELRVLLGQAYQARNNLMPQRLTLSEASRLYGLKAATLRRACWTGRLKGEKRGKTWFVSYLDLEHYCSTF